MTHGGQNTQLFSTPTLPHLLPQIKGKSNAKFVSGISDTAI